MSTSFHSKLQEILDDEEKLQQVSDKSFNKYDTDNSGYIEAKEFHKIINDLYKKLGQPLPKKSEISKMLGELDDNGDQRLDKSEFKEHTRDILQSMLDGTLGK